MSPSPFERLESACSGAVERAFAFAFPSALQPVVIARKLVAAFEAGAATPRERRRFTVRLHPSDYARFRGDLPYLERQWSAMLAGLAERSRAQRPAEVASRADASVAAGTVAITADVLDAPQALVLRVRKGLPQNALPLRRSFVIGREAGCGFVLADPRVSRRHVAVVVADGVAFRDLGSSNGTQLNGVGVASGILTFGDVLGLGDSELVVDAER